MIQEHALRRLEYFLHNYCTQNEVKPIIDNILLAADRGYSFGTYNISGHFVSAPVENPDQRLLNTFEEEFWPFSGENHARRFLALLNHYFEVRGARVEVLGIEGYVIR